MRDHSIPNGLCHVDPITMLTSAAVGLIPGLMGGGGDSASAPAPAPPLSTPPPQQQPVGSKTQNKSQAPTFLGAAATPQPAQSSQKTLLGQ